jgi:hypothetical protein
LGPPGRENICSLRKFFFLIFWNNCLLDSIMVSVNSQIRFG